MGVQMTSDLLLVAGVIFGILAFPTIVSAFTYGKSLRAASIFVVLSAGLIALAALYKPGRLSLQDVPGAFVRVTGAVLR